MKTRPTRTLAQAIAQGYVVMRSSYRISNAFWRYCRAVDAPFVRIRLKAVFASVSVDLFGASYEMSEAAWREIYALLRSHHVGRWAPPYAGRDFAYLCSPRIPIDQAAPVAEQILAILAKPGYREPREGGYSPLVNELDEALRKGMVLA